MSSVFISYRRADSIQVTGRIYDKLLAFCGKDRLFKDTDSIPLGSDFRQSIDAFVCRCDVMLVVVGELWLGITDEGGRRRLDDPNDFVRVEVESALKRNIPVIPLLLDNARMPSAEELPSTLRDFAYRNATKIRPDPDFHTDMERVIQAIRQISSAKRPASSASFRPPSTIVLKPLPEAGGNAVPGQSKAPAPERRASPKPPPDDDKPVTTKPRSGRAGSAAPLEGGAPTPRVDPGPVRHGMPQAHRVDEPPRVLPPTANSRPTNSTLYVGLLVALVILFLGGGGFVYWQRGGNPQSLPVGAPQPTPKGALLGDDEKQTKRKRAEEFVRQGDDFLQKKDLGSAIEAYTKAIQTDPKWIRAYSKRAEAYKQNKDMMMHAADVRTAETLSRER